MWYHSSVWLLLFSLRVYSVSVYYTQQIYAKFSWCAQVNRYREQKDREEQARIAGTANCQTSPSSGNIHVLIPSSPNPLINKQIYDRPGTSSNVTTVIQGIPAVTNSNTVVPGPGDLQYFPVIGENVSLIDEGKFTGNSNRINK